MNKQDMIEIAERNLRKAEKSLLNNYNRKGVTEFEREKLSNNVEYAKAVYGLIVDHVK